MNGADDNRQRTDGKRSSAGSWSRRSVVGALGTGAVVGASGLASGTDTPTVPASYYGTVERNEEPAPEGTILEVEVADEVVAETTVEAEGRFGGAPDPEPGEYLTVVAEPGQQVRFFINDDDIDRTQLGESVLWQEGAVQELALTTEVDEATVELANLDIAGQGDDAVRLAEESGDVTVDVTNTGDEDGVFDVTLQILLSDTGEEIISETEPVEVSRGETEEVEFGDVLGEIDDVGFYDVVVSADDADITGELLLSVDLTGNEEPATDTTGDGLLNDVMGDEAFTIADVQALFDALGDAELEENAEFFNFSGLNEESVTIFDVQALFNIYTQDVGDSLTTQPALRR